jgi:hypothetical protein
MSNTALNRPLRSIVLSFKVRCPAVEEDNSLFEEVCCEWEGTLSSYMETHHRYECKFSEKECRWECDACFRVSDLKDHEENACLHRVVPCTAGCGKTGIRYYDLDDHLDMYCSDTMVSCGYCSEEMQRKHLGKRTYWTDTDDPPGSSVHIRDTSRSVPSSGSSASFTTKVACIDF